nr:Aerobic C4-dicarboxylate transporter [Raoultella sp. NCTC 9187]
MFSDLLVRIGAAAHAGQDGEAGLSQIGRGAGIPTGYSFNLDGTSIYLTMAAVFIAQATNSHMDIFHR